MKTIIAMLLIACGGSGQMHPDAGAKADLNDLCKKWDKICLPKGNGHRDCFYFCTGY